MDPVSNLNQQQMCCSSVCLKATAYILLYYQFWGLEESLLSDQLSIYQSVPRKQVHHHI